MKETAGRLSAQGKYGAAEECLRQAARCLRRAGSGSRSERAIVWNALGIVCKYLGKFRSARRYYQRALDHSRYLAGLERVQLLADLYHNLGGLEHAQDSFARAEKYARKGLRMRLQSSAAGSPAIASDLAALAAILDGLGKCHESEKLYHQALRIYRRHFGANHAEIAVVLNNLGALHQAAGHHERAARYYRNAVRMKRRVLGKSHPDLVLTMNNLATLLYAQGRPSGARQWSQKALQLAIISIGKRHPITQKIRNNCDRLNTAVLRRQREARSSRR